MLWHILALLPADARGRAATVCRLWRDALASPDAWLALDVSETSGVAVALRTPALLRGASARARGGLVTLDASGVAFNQRRSRRVFETLLELVTAIPSALRALRNPSNLWLSAKRLGALVDAAPALTALHADAYDSAAALAPLARA